MFHRLLLDPESGTVIGGGMAALSDTPGLVTAPSTPAPAPTPAAPQTPTAPVVPAGTPSATPGGAEPQAPAAPNVVPLQQPTQMTPEQIAQLVVQAQNNVRPPAAPQAPATVQDMERMFNVWQPTQDDVTALLGGGEAALGAVARMRDAITRQALTMASFAFEQKLEDFAQRYGVADIHQDYNTRQTERVKNDFFKQYPQYEKQEQLIVAIGAQMRQQGFQGTKEEAFTEVAKRAATVLAQAGVTIPPSQGGSGTQTTPAAAPAVPGMPSLSTGGHGGGGAPTGGGSSKNAGLAALAD